VKERETLAAKARNNIKTSALNKKGKENNPAQLRRSNIFNIKGRTNVRARGFPQIIRNHDKLKQCLQKLSTKFLGEARVKGGE